MMVGVFSLGALLLVLLAGASYSRPVKQGFDYSASYSNSYGSNPASAGSTWDVPSSGNFAVAASGIGAASASNPALTQTAPRRTGYPQPSVHREPPAAFSSSSSLTSAEHSGYPSSSSEGSHSAFQPSSTRAIAWEVAPPSPFSGEETSTGPSAHRFASNEPLDPSNTSPPAPFPPAFQAGELYKTEQLYEHGDYESETEEQGFPPQPPVAVFKGDSTGQLQPAGPGRSWVEYPYDYMLVTGQYPPGTITHSSVSFEQGMDHWQDTHYIRNNFPAGQDQPYGAVGLQGSYYQPGAFEPHQHSPAGGHGFSKVGY